MKNITAVVTGGTRGIGLGIAESLVKRGARLAVTYMSSDDSAKFAREKLNSLRQGTGKPDVLILKGDVGDADSVREHYEKVKKELGPVNVLVNNAGIMPVRKFEEITEKEWEETIRINLNGSFYWTKHVVMDMKEQGFGRIINISSIAARGGGVVGPHYAASKAGMLGMMQYAARELGPYGITVNAIAPAFIEDAGVFTEWSKQEKESLSEKVMTPRIGNVNDVIRAFDYLIDSPFVTSATLDVSGGA